MTEIRKLAEDTVEEWHKRMELAQQAGLRIGLWDWDLVTNTLAWSDETYRQFGLTPETFSGKVEDAVERIHPADRLRVVEAIRKVLEGESEYAAQYRILRPDGSTCWVNAHGIVVRNDESARMLGIEIDITNVKKIEESLDEAKLELAHVARAAIVGELTASIVHEINQALAAIVTNASALRRWLGAQPPNLQEAEDAAKRAIREANRASEVIARIRSLLTKTAPQMAPLDINEVIRQVLSLTRGEILKAGVTAKVELADVPAVFGDYIQLEQVMFNLIRNAIDAMITVPEGQRKLIIRSAYDKEFVSVQVQDSGRGMDLQTAERIFEPFFTTKPQGIGMGLSISRSIIEAHRGHLFVKYFSLHGSVFEFHLPKLIHE